jgi:hypothetical protein
LSLARDRLDASHQVNSLVQRLVEIPSFIVREPLIGLEDDRDLVRQLVPSTACAKEPAMEMLIGLALLPVIAYLALMMLHAWAEVLQLLVGLFNALFDGKGRKWF